MAKNPLAVVILAAGKGTRMKSDQPKVLHELAGLPMISWLLKTVESLNPEKIIVVVGPGMPELLQAVKPHQAVIQEVRNGTAGAVKAALPALKNFKGNVLVLAGDVPLVTKETLQNLVDARGDDLRNGITVLGVTMNDPTGYGRLVTGEDGALVKIAEQKDATAREKEIKLVNAGVFCFDGERLADWIGQVKNKNAADEFYLTDLPQLAAKDKALTNIYETCDPCEVRGCNSRADLSALEQTLQNRLRENLMDAGVTMQDPSSVYLWHDTKIAKDVTIEPHVFFGPGVEIASGCIIRAFSHIEGATIGKDAQIGPFARLRPGSEIGGEARIGNFVEVKKSRIGRRSKINHLAYVGDTMMGEDVNFGAGAITVNYDGYQKHETVIGKGVMVGSNVNLVAPLTLEDGAFVAAGSTITEDVPAGALSIARDEPEIRKGWVKEYRKRKELLMARLAQKKPGQKPKK